MQAPTRIETKVSVTT